MTRRPQAKGPERKHRGSLPDAMVAAARSWSKFETFDLDYDDPGIDDAFFERLVRLLKIAQGRGFADFRKALVEGASTLVSTGDRHVLHRELFLLPFVGPSKTIEDLAVDAARMGELSEAIRRTASETPVEDVVLLPVVLDAEALSLPTLAGLRRAARAMAACLDAEDPYEDAEMAGLASDVAEALAGRVAGSPTTPGATQGSSINALVGLACSRCPAGSDTTSSPLFAPRRDKVSVAAMLDAIAGAGLRSTAPGRWPTAATRASLVEIDVVLRAMAARSGILASTPRDEIRLCPSSDGAPMSLAAVCGDVVLGPLELPGKLTTQDPQMLAMGMTALAADMRMCDAATLMERPRAAPGLILRPGAAKNPFRPRSLLDELRCTGTVDVKW